MGALVRRGSGWSPTQRWDIPSAREALHFRMGGSSGSRRSMPDASFPLRCSCADQRSRPSKSTVGTGPGSPMSAQDPAGSPSFGPPMTRPWCGPTAQTGGRPSCGLHRTMPPEGETVQPHTWERSTSNSQPGEDGSKPCSISQRAATRLRSDHQPRITSRSTSCRNQRRRHRGAPRVRVSGWRGRTGHRHGLRLTSRSRR